jgi:hypothetical protein
MPSLTLHDIASALGARLIGVECQHCIRRRVLTAEAVKARRGDGRTLEEASVRCSACGTRRITATRLGTRSAPHTIMRNLSRLPPDWLRSWNAHPEAAAILDEILREPMRLVVAADRVSMEVAKMLEDEMPTERSGNTSFENLALQSLDTSPQPEDFDISSLRIDFTYRQT